MPDDLPAYLDYRTWEKSDSMKNTPCTFAWYVAVEVLEWIDAIGGLEALGARNQSRAELLYGVIDGSDFYHNPVDPDARSVMNVPFTLTGDGDGDLTRRFVTEADAAGMQGLKGHRAVGGLRASLYNALDDAAVGDLIEFMREFERSRG